jgi:hypothetical protein
MSIFFLPRLIPVASFLLGGGGDSKAVVIDGVSWWSEATEAVRGSKPTTLEVSALSSWKDADAIARESGCTAAVR